MSLIPEALLKSFRSNAHKMNCYELNSLIAFRDYLTENMANGKPRFPIGELYAEAAEAMGYAVNTLERKIRTIREYDARVLQGWIDAGLSMDHIENANQFQKFPPASLLDLAVDAGEGKPATVEQMIALANGGKPLPPAAARVNRAWDFIRKVPYWLKLPEAVRDEFLADVEQLRQKWSAWLQVAPEAQ